jgi:hypothetical protein
MTSVVIRNPSRGVYVASWLPLGRDKCGEAANMPLETFTRSVQVAGEFEGCKVHLEGSHDGAYWSPLLDELSEGTIQDISLTHYVRPRVVGGGDKTAVKIILMTV